mgnify:CR=1 FL=1
MKSKKPDPIGGGIVLLFGIGVLISWLNKLFSGEIFDYISQIIAKEGSWKGWVEGGLAGAVIIIGVPLFIIMLIKLVTEGS